MITIPLLIAVATVLSLLPMAAYHLNLSFKMKTDSLVSFLIGVWSMTFITAMSTTI